ncbi:MAG TPA: tRNA (adenosine(37)-N6)-dimethylallyltransferase MiaA [Acidimicrobiales bacterium]
MVGTTASGKSAVAHAVAQEAGDIEICSVDSMQVYRGMDIGTAKPSAAERAEVPYHLLDLAEPDHDFTLSEFQAAMAAALAEIEGRGHRALLVGGTALYLRAVVDALTLPPPYPEVRAELEAEPDTEALHARLAELDPVGASRMEPTNRRRVVRALEVTIGSGQPFSANGAGLEEHPPTPFALVGLWLPREVVAARIRARYERQVAAGFVDEVRALLARPAGLSRTARQALGYRQLVNHVEDGVPLEDALTAAVNRTTRFARRQRSWFRRDPRIHWVGHPENPLAVKNLLLRDWNS